MDINTLEKLAKLLPGTWQVVAVPHERNVLQDEIGRQFHIRTAYLDDGRYSVHGDWPESKYAGQMWPNERPSITVAKTRPLDKIAADIQRRFLPDFIRVWDEQKAKGDRHDAYAEVTTNLYNELRALVRPNYPPAEIKYDQVLECSDWESGLRKVRVVGEDRVTIELECSGDEAKEFIRQKLAKPVPTEK